MIDRETDAQLDEILRELGRLRAEFEASAIASRERLEALREDVHTILDHMATPSDPVSKPGETLD